MGFKIISEGAFCEVCGRQFGTTEARDKHRAVHIDKRSRQGLSPRFVHDPKTGSTVFKGFKLKDNF